MEAVNNLSGPDTLLSFLWKRKIDKKNPSALFKENHSKENVNYLISRAITLFNVIPALFAMSSFFEQIDKLK